MFKEHNSGIVKKITFEIELDLRLYFGMFSIYTSL